MERRQTRRRDLLTDFQQGTSNAFLIKHKKHASSVHNELTVSQRLDETVMRSGQPSRLIQQTPKGEV
jgi:hypothetical protein